MRLLLKSGADSSLKNYHNDTPVMVTRNKKVSSPSQTQSEVLLLHICASDKNKNVVRFLVIVEDFTDQKMTPSVLDGGVGV